ncbi:hypothetical protein BDR04DRAFT_1164408 [Suillus decipiens]|nr:hypothetical protein BDR04DRAFT_1164408 [Suillus decipiens]
MFFSVPVLQFRRIQNEPPVILSVPARLFDIFWETYGALIAIVDYIKSLHIEMKLRQAPMERIKPIVIIKNRNTLASTSYFSASPHLPAENFAENNTAFDLVEGLAKSTAFEGQFQVRSSAHVFVNSHRSSARILFIVQPNEHNVFDQRLPCSRSIIPSFPPSLDFRPLRARTRNHNPFLNQSLTIRNLHDLLSISAHPPFDFPSPSYGMPFLLERSRAIKCPSLPLQLAGGKKVQETLTPGVLERFLGDEGAKWGTRAVDLTAHAADGHLGHLDGYAGARLRTRISPLRLITSRLQDRDKETYRQEHASRASRPHRSS